MKTGAQLYTVRLFTQTVPDFQETMRRVAEIGYRTVQLSAIGGAVTPQIARETADETGLEIVLTHSDLNRILTDTEQLIRDHETMGCKYIGIGSMPEKYRNPDWIKRFAADFKEPARMIKDECVSCTTTMRLNSRKLTADICWITYWMTLRRMNWELRWTLTGCRLRAGMYASGSSVWQTGFHVSI